MFDFFLTLASSTLERIVKKRKEDGKENKALKTIFSTKIQKGMIKLTKLYFGTLNVVADDLNIEVVESEDFNE